MEAKLHFMQRDIAEITITRIALEVNFILRISISHLY